jgi:hypothetical protein
MAKFTRLQRNLIAGAGTVACLAPASLGARLPQFNRSDSEALRGDWEKLGGDIRAAMSAHPLPAFEQAESE